MKLGNGRLLAIFALLTISGLAIGYFCHLAGFISMVVTLDTSTISLWIPAVFLVGWLMCAARVWRLNGAFSDLDRGSGTEITRYRVMAKVNVSNATEELKVKLGRKLMWIKQIFAFLPVLGLFGTAVGLVMALFSNELATAQTVTPEMLQAQFPVIVTGLGVAFFTTVVGIVFMVWGMLFSRLLEVESMRLLEGILEKSHKEMYELTKQEEALAKPLKLEAAPEPAPAPQPAPEPEPAKPSVSDPAPAPEIEKPAAPAEPK